VGSNLQDKKLLIYVPTYNRASAIERQLSSLLPQIRGLSSVQLIVSDNASPEPSWAVIKTMMSTFDNAYAQRTPSNIGGNANALLGFTFPLATEYVWILSDDTILASNAIETILGSIDTNPDLISVKMLESQPSRNLFDIRKDGITEVFDSTTWGQFGSLIYSRKFISDSLGQGFAFHESSFPHLAILFDACWKNGIAQVTEVEGKRVFSSLYEDNLSGGVYSLSLAGRSSLLHFANPHEREALAKTWSRANSLGIATFEERHPSAAGASRSALIQYGGLAARWNLFLGRWLYALLRSKFGKYLTERVRGSAVLMGFASKTGVTFFALPANSGGENLN
jgi:glycosyltransferase involved in cell wall biosynthesis